MTWDPVTEGWTGDLPFALLSNDLPYDLTGATVTLILKTQDGRTVFTDGNVDITDAAQGLVRYSPDPGDLMAKDSPYLGRFQVIKSGKKIFFPAGPEEQWVIYVP